MTFLEKFRENTQYVGDLETVIMAMCPEDFGLEEEHRKCALTAGESWREACMSCWNREADNGL